MADQPFVLKAVALLLAEPSATYTLNDDTVDETVTETKTFLVDPDDEDSDIVVTRTVERNGNQEALTVSAWTIANIPTIDSITTDNDDTATVRVSGDTVLTIDGSNFGAEDADIEVLLFVRQKNQDYAIGPTPFKNRLRIPAVITNIAGGDDQITATVSLSSYRKHMIGVGPCEVLVWNKKRHLISAEFPLTVV